VDLGPAIEVGMYSPFDAERFFHIAFSAVLQDENLDSFIVFFFGLQRSFLLFDRALSKLVSITKEKPKPLFFSIMGDKQETDEITKLLESEGFPVYPEITRAVKAMSAMYQYYRFNCASQSRRLTNLR
jgi:acyl-CoA synthetase (NDP forming)